MALCPVCKAAVNPTTAAGGMLWHEGAPYYFDSERCNVEFQKKPSQYLFG